MAYGQDGGRVAYPADADFSATGQYRAVKRTATGIDLCGANAADFLGVLIDNPALGAAGTVQTRDAAKVAAGGVFAAGVALTTDADGRFVAAAAGEHVCAKALEAGAVGNLTTVELTAGTA
jgi:hypothetical protein